MEGEKIQETRHFHGMYSMRKGEGGEEVKGRKEGRKEGRQESKKGLQLLGTWH